MAAVHVRCRPKVEDAAWVVAVLSVIVVATCCCYLMDHRGMGVTRVRFAVLNQKVGNMNFSIVDAVMDFL